jgi:hypothetical protein
MPSSGTGKAALLGMLQAAVERDAILPGAAHGERRLGQILLGQRHGRRRPSQQRVDIRPMPRQINVEVQHVAGGGAAVGVRRADHDVLGRNPAVLADPPANRRDVPAVQEADIDHQPRGHVPRRVGKDHRLGAQRIVRPPGGIIVAEIAQQRQPRRRRHIHRSHADAKAPHNVVLQVRPTRKLRDLRIGASYLLCARPLLLVRTARPKKTTVNSAIGVDGSGTATSTICARLPLRDL